MKDNKISRFYYLETFLLLAFFIIATLVLSRVFVSGRSTALQAKRLTDAVCISENVAEIVKASKTGEQISQRLNGDNRSASENEVRIQLFYDQQLKQADKGLYQVDVSVRVIGEGLYESEITVTDTSSTERLYQLSLTADDWGDVHE